MLPSHDLFAGRLVRLAAPRPEDKDSYIRWSTDPEYLRLMDDEPAVPMTAEMYTLPKDSDRSFHFHVRTLAEDRVIGFVVLHSIIWNNRAAWLTIGIGDPAYRDKGYGTDALSLILAYGFRELGLHRVSLNVFSYNERAIAAYEKVGFVQEGRLRETVYRDGQRFDTIYMGILRREWEARRRTETSA